MTVFSMRRTPSGQKLANGGPEHRRMEPPDMFPPENPRFRKLEARGKRGRISGSFHSGAPPVVLTIAYKKFKSNDPEFFCRFYPSLFPPGPVAQWGAGVSDGTPCSAGCAKKRFGDEVVPLPSSFSGANSHSRMNRSPRSGQRGRDGSRSPRQSLSPRGNACGSH